MQIDVGPLDLHSQVSGAASGSSGLMVVSQESLSCLPALRLVLTERWRTFSVSFCRARRERLELRCLFFMLHITLSSGAVKYLFLFSFLSTRG